MPIQNILEIYARTGISLAHKGVKEAAIPLSETDAVLELFREQKWRILGGDVYYLDDNNDITFTYETWAYSGNSVDESIGVAYEYMKSFKSKSGKVYIVFVVVHQE